MHLTVETKREVLILPWRIEADEKFGVPLDGVRRAQVEYGAHVHGTSDLLYVSRDQLQQRKEL